MRRLRTYLAALCVTIIASCTSSKISDRDVENHFKTAVAGVQAFYLSPRALKETELAARGGSAEAAEKLSLHYGFVSRDLEKQIYWLEKAVELGKEEERENLKVLLEARDDDERIKAAKRHAPPLSPSS